MAAQIEKWKDGSNMVCTRCEQFIFVHEARYANKSHNPKNREAKHFKCDPASSLIII